MRQLTETEWKTVRKRVLEKLEGSAHPEEIGKKVDEIIEKLKRGEKP